MWTQSVEKQSDIRTASLRIRQMIIRERGKIDFKMEATDIIYKIRQKICGPVNSFHSVGKWTDMINITGEAAGPVDNFTQ